MDLDKENQKKLQGIFSFTILPYWLHWVGSSFSVAYVAAFYASGPYSPAQNELLASNGIVIVIMFTLAYIWARPAILYRKTQTEELRGKMRRRIENAYRDGGILLLAMVLTRLAWGLFRGGSMPPGTMPAILLGLLVQACTLPIAIDWIRTKNSLIMGMLYSDKELYRLRPGFSLPLYIKIVLLIVAYALAPFALIYLSADFGTAFSAWSVDMRNLLFTCTVNLLVGLGVLFYGIQRPMDGLIEKMRRVSAGDYDVMTHIYFSDEVARLKAGFNEMVAGLRERKEMEDAFGKYFSIEVAKELIKNKKVNLGGEYMDAAVMFCDIRNFTPLSENLSAGEMVEFLNTYFGYITPPIAAHNGIINKFMGDSVMAVFTPLLGSGHFASDAVRAAVEMRQALAAYNASGKAPAEIKFGIGVHSGRLVAGNVGTLSRLEYTFIGDTVNTAARLQSKTKDFSTDILVSQAVLDGLAGRAADLRFESAGSAELKGKKKPVELYKIL
ncbi:MAG TPA: hypothetical protein DCZ92_09080 [Elusimicrobia bacterium]|nr:MAG: hypothetical protein A2016_05930 [Elusimicrobia bacterium GWF2_62_30]HBA60958.1 hypothetical protein [Elusimicrobiota bacterium]